MRIVSLVPSLTLTLWDLGVAEHVVGVTKFCVRPEEARTRATVIGGTKDPDLARIRGLRPDLVLADEDENKPEHRKELESFSRVHTTQIESVDDAARELQAIGRLVGREHEAEARAQKILEEAQRLQGLARLFPATRAFVPIWRKPLMTLNGATYASDLLRGAGAENVFAKAPRKYFETTFEEVRVHEPEAVLLPTEPFRFREPHRAEFAQALGLDSARVRIVDGQALTWFGTYTEEGQRRIAEAVAALRGASAAQRS